MPINFSLLENSNKVLPNSTASFTTGRTSTFESAPIKGGSSKKYRNKHRHSKKCRKSRKNRKSRRR